MRRLIALLMLSLVSWSRAEEISVGVAVSMKDAVLKLAEASKAQTGDTYAFSYGSSGQLAAQIDSGAPIDLFISAANKQVNDLIRSKVADAATRQVVAGNALVLIVPSRATNPPQTLAALTDVQYKKIAVGEPKSVPAGQYAAEALKNAGLAETLKDRLVYGSNVRQVLDYVEREEVSAGIVYATDARQSGPKVQVCFQIQPELHSPIVYPAVVISNSKHADGAKKFLAFILSEKGQAILKDFGFAAPPETSPAPASQTGK